jgi:hypothetical protein
MIGDVESLARAIHDDDIKAAALVGTIFYDDDSPVPLSFELLPEKWKVYRREQARRMLERIMR